jgi:hypothetical protein
MLALRGAHPPGLVQGSTSIRNVTRQHSACEAPCCAPSRGHRQLSTAIWRQDEYHYEYRYAYRPTAIINNGRMQVNGMSRAVRVRRL